MCAANAILLFLLLNVLLVCSSHASAAANKDVHVDGGLNDASAVVGKLFLYTIQPSAFSGHVRNYQVGDALRSTFYLLLHCANIMQSNI